jgi:hypothetical protein
MDRTEQLLRHLAEAERHIALGERHISNQEMRITDFDLRGYDSTLARSSYKHFSTYSPNTSRTAITSLES